jgi:hypothetical protein
MVDQVTFDIGGGVSAGATVLQLVANMLTGARSVTVEVDNNTDLTLVLFSQGHYHGGWAVKHPLLQIGPRKPDPKDCTDVFGSQSTGGSIATGTAGWVGYHGYKGNPFGSKPILRFTVQWDNPYLTDNDADAWLVMLDRSKGMPYKARYEKGVGNTQAPFRFMLFS